MEDVDQPVRLLRFFKCDEISTCQTVRLVLKKWTKSVCDLLVDWE